MKRSIAWMGTFFLTASLLLGGCGQAADEQSSSAISEETSSEAETAPSEAESASSAEQEDADAAAAETTSEEASEEDSSAESSSADAASSAETSAAGAAVGDGDLSAAIQDSETSGEKPAPLGQWVKTCAYSSIDRAYHPIYVRVNKITTQSEDAQYIEDCVKASNANVYEFKQLDLSELKLPDDVELCLMDYDILFADSFPSDGGIIFGSGLGMRATNPEGGGIASQDGSSTYVGMGQVEDLSMKDTTKSVPTYQPGEVNPMQGLFAMVKGNQQYVITYQSYPEGTTSDSMSMDSMVKVFHAAH